MFIFNMKMAYPHVIYNQRHSSSLLLISVLCLLCYTGRSDIIGHETTTKAPDDGSLQDGHEDKRCVVVKTCVGDDAVLPCKVDPTILPDVDCTDLAVHWTRLDLPNDQYVYFQRDGEEIDTLKNPFYKGRTSLFKDEMKKGNMSLKLSTVNSSDEGIYTCRITHIEEFQEECTVQRIVGCDITGHESTTKAPDDRSLKDGHVEDTNLSTAEEFPRWVYLIVTLIIFVIISIICGVVFKDKLSNLAFSRKFLRRKKTDSDENRSMDGVSEFIPMNVVSVDKPDEGD